MKARKQIRRVELVEEVLRQTSLRFVPPIPLLNECIKTLVQKEYMEHDTVNDELIYT